MPVKILLVTNGRYAAGSGERERVGDTILSRGRWRGGPVFLKVILGFSILIAVRLQELGPHRQTKRGKTFTHVDELSRALSNL